MHPGNSRRSSKVSFGILMAQHLMSRLTSLVYTCLRRQSKEYSTNPCLLLRGARARFVLSIIRSCNSRLLSLAKLENDLSWSPSTWRDLKIDLEKKFVRYGYFRSIGLNVEKCYLWIMGYGDHMVVQWPREKGRNPTRGESLGLQLSLSHSNSRLPHR